MLSFAPREKKRLNLEAGQNKALKYTCANALLEAGRTEARVAEAVMGSGCVLREAWSERGTGRDTKLFRCAECCCVIAANSRSC